MVKEYVPAVKNSNYKFLNHLIVSKDKNVWNTLIYPSW